MGSWGWFWFFQIALPVFISIFSSRTTISKTNAAYEYMSNAVINKLGRADYYNAGEHGAIAVDVKNKKIAAIRKNGKKKYFEPCIFSVENIRGYKSYAPGHELFSGGAMKDFNRAAMSAAASHQKSGIYIDLDDVKNPQIFVQMEYEEAEKWHLIFEKLQDGSLDEQAAPMLFPQA
jgi:hypothetical protein